MRTIQVTDRAADYIEALREGEGELLNLKKAQLFDILTCLLDNADENGGASPEERALIASITDHADLLGELAKVNG